MALVDMFLKLDGVEGESQDPEHKNEIQIHAFNMNARVPHDPAGGGQSGKYRFSDLTIHANVEKGTAKLFDLAVKNSKIPKAVLACRKAGKEQFEYFRITLTDCYIRRVEIGSVAKEGGSVVPPCEFDVEYGTIEIKSKEQTPKGPTSGAITAMFDLRSNQ